jgi:hypothetical protein
MQNKKVSKLCYIMANPDPGDKNRGLYCGKHPLMVVLPVSFN